MPKQCPFCSEEIQETAKKCKHCGEFVNKNPTNFFTILAMISLVIGIIFGIGGRMEYFFALFVIALLFGYLSNKKSTKFKNTENAK